MSRAIKTPRGNPLQEPATRTLLLTIGVVGVVILAMNSWSHVLFLALALVPAAAAGFLERKGPRVAAPAIVTLTLATVIPLIFGAVSNEGRVLLTNPAAWSFVGASILTAVAIFLLLPASSVWLDDMQAEARLKKLRQQQDLLEKDWGPEVRAKIDN
jgi:hypothetical protein